MVVIRRPVDMRVTDDKAHGEQLGRWQARFWRAGRPMLARRGGSAFWADVLAHPLLAEAAHPNGFVLTSTWANPATTRRAAKPSGSTGL
jgi:hypothetical protein